MLTKLYREVDQESEQCFYIEHDTDFEKHELDILYYLLGTSNPKQNIKGIEIGPTLHIKTPC